MTPAEVPDSLACGSASGMTGEWAAVAAEQRWRRNHHDAPFPDVRPGATLVRGPKEGHLTSLRARERLRLSLRWGSP
jgi:hypothetical protein